MVVMPIFRLQLKCTTGPCRGQQRVLKSPRRARLAPGHRNQGVGVEPFFLELAKGRGVGKLQKKTPNPQIRHRCKLNCKYHFSSSIQRAGLLQQSVMILSNPLRRRVVSSHGLMSVLSRTVTYCHVLSRTVMYCHGTVTPIAKTWLNCVV